MKYCRFCGTALQDGDICTCAPAQAAARQEWMAAQQRRQQQQPPVNPQQQQPLTPQQAPVYSRQRTGTQTGAAQAQQKARAAARGLVGYLKAYFASPAAAVRQGDRLVGILLTVIRVLSVGLVIFGVLNKICGLSGSTVGKYLKISPPFFGSLLYGALIAAIGMGLYILAIFAVAKIQKSGLSLAAAWQYSANNGVLTTALLLLGFLLSFLSIRAALVCVLLAVLASLLFSVLTMQFACGGNRSGLFWLAFFAGTAIVLFLCYKLFPTLILKAVGGIKLHYSDKTTTIGKLMGDTLDELKDAFDADTFSDIFSSMFRRILY